MSLFIHTLSARFFCVLAFTIALPQTTHAISQQHVERKAKEIATFLRDNAQPIYFLAATCTTIWCAYHMVGILQNIKAATGNVADASKNIQVVQQQQGFSFETSTVTFADVAGNDAAKEALADIVDFLENPEKFEQSGARIPRGVLMTGEPGNGKTLLARALAGEAGVPFIAVSGSQFDEVFVGLGAARIRALFKAARDQNSPCIIFIDEIDAVGKKRNNSPFSGSGGQEQTLNQLLTEMDGFTQNDRIIVIGATNRVEILDDALVRPGRLDRKVTVAYPDVTSREAILKVHAKNKKIASEVDLSVIARATSGFSGADLANLINEALIVSVKAGHAEATLADFNEAHDTIRMGARHTSLIRTPEELRQTAYHEAGHALLHLLFPKTADPLHKLTILARGNALGLTWSLPEGDRVGMSQEQFITLIKILCAGRIAENMMFGHISTGASNDFERATSLARSMVCNYGMSDLGQMVYEQDKISDEMAYKVDQEVRKIIDTCYAETVKLLTTHRAMLVTLAEELLKKEELSADEVYALLKIEPRTSHKIA